MRGRHPSGPEFVDRLGGSPEAKQRAKILLETLRGELRVLEACDMLGIKDARFDQIRIEGLQGMIDALEPKLPGRKPRPATPEAAQLEQLQQRVAELQAQLSAALIRAELAVTLPQVGAADQKKKRRTHRRPRE